MRIGIPRQSDVAETRAAMTPAVVKKLAGEQVQFFIEAGAGVGSGASDTQFSDVGTTIVDSAQADEAIWAQADVVVTINPPTAEKVGRMKEGAVLVASAAPLVNHDLVRACCDRKVTLFSMEFVPRTTRAQAMDVLSSQANIGGYKAVLLGANVCPKMFPMMMTAAGTLAAAKVLIIGVGVAGLQAIATAKRLGAIVEAYDVRAATKEQVLSLGARFVELPGAKQDDKATGGYAKEQTEEERQQQAELMAKHVIGTDVVVTTAALFGKAPPLLIPRDVVAKMSPGSVIVDMAADPGAGRGNCEATHPGETYTTDNGVTLVGTRDLPRLLPVHATQAYATNMQNFLGELISKEGELTVNLEDEIQKGAAITHAGEVVNDLVKEKI